MSKSSPSNRRCDAFLTPISVLRSLTVRGLSRDITEIDRLRRICLSTAKDLVTLELRDVEGVGYQNVPLNLNFLTALNFQVLLLTATKATLRNFISSQSHLCCPIEVEHHTSEFKKNSQIDRKKRSPLLKKKKVPSSVNIKKKGWRREKIGILDGKKERERVKWGIFEEDLSWFTLTSE